MVTKLATLFDSREKMIPFAFWVTLSSQSIGLHLSVLLQISLEGQFLLILKKSQVMKQCQTINCKS